ncbi:MAG TPA: DUF1206 domain-containing protein [Allosphingosinicella sp.]|jgi:hypothetical protein
MASPRSFEAMTRIGFAARGVMYMLIGLLALKSGRTEDGAGAMEMLGSGFGRVALAAMAVGFLCYGLWRLSEAALDTQRLGRDVKGVAVRASGAVSGLVHLSLAWIAVRLAMGNGGGGGGTRAKAAEAMALPGGWLLLAAAALGIGVAGAFQLVRAARGDFTKHLDGEAAGRAWVVWLGRAGYAARGIIFLLMAWFFARAAWTAHAREAGGIGEALDSLPASLRTAVAAGLLLFGVFSLVEARHRRIATPPVGAQLKALGEAAR